MWICAAPYRRCHPPLTGVSLAASEVTDDDGDDGDDGGGGQPGGLWTHTANEPVEAAATFASIHALPSVHLDQRGNTLRSVCSFLSCAQFSKLS